MHFSSSSSLGRERGREGEAREGKTERKKERKKEMLDGLLGRGFSTKCKSKVEIIRRRIDLIRRKRTSMIRFFKKDIAELLSSGLDLNAYSRAEGLIVELNISSCYDLIEQFCGCILEQLSSMHKQREFPPECREAASSLMFAAARFADLPELRDLRNLFTERFGNTVASSANQELMEKLSPKPSSVEQKLKLMQEISQEFSVNWDPKALRDSNASMYSSDQPKPHNLSEDGTFTKTERQEMHGEQYTPGTRYTRRQELNAYGKEADSVASEKDYKQVGTDITCKKESLENFKPRNHNKIPPYTSQRGSKYGTDLQVLGSNSNHKEPPYQFAGDNGHGKQDFKPEGSNGFGDGNGHDLDQDKSASNPKPKPRSVRRKHLKPPVEESAATPEAIEHTKIRSSGSRRVHENGHSHPTSNVDQDEEKIMDELLMRYSNKKSPDITGVHAAHHVVDTGESLPSQNNGSNRSNSESARHHIRAMSLPRKPTATEVPKVTARAASFQPEMLNGHVHPKLPDYDDLTARFAALKGRMG